MLSHSMSYLLFGLALLNLLMLGIVARALGRPTGAGLPPLDLRLDAMDRNTEALRSSLTAMDQALRGAIAASARDGLAVAFDKVQQGSKAQADQLGAFGGELRLGLDRMQAELAALAERLRSGFEAFSDRLRDEQERLREAVDGKLEAIRTGNEAKLEAMRKAVDEQLQSALERRLQESFQRVTEQFAQIHEAVGQVKSVTGQIGDLKRLFSNVKARGGWGEAHIQALLDDVLPPGAYQKNLRIDAGSGEVVEFALRMPLRGASGDVWLAIDAKFPTEDYDRLLLAGEAGDRDEEAAARKALDRRIREEAKRISSKYISPPQTAEFAVMYLPSDGLFLEVAHLPGLVETLRRQHGVAVTGPAILPGLLHMIRVGHLTLALEQKAGMIGEILAAVKAEWGNLGKSLDVLARRAETLNSGIRDTQVRTRAVGRTLRTVDALDFGKAERVLGLTGPGDPLLPAEAPGYDAGGDDAEDYIPVVADAAQ